MSCKSDRDPAVVRYYETLQLVECQRESLTQRCRKLIDRILAGDVDADEIWEAIKNKVHH